MFGRRRRPRSFGQEDFGKEVEAHLTLEADRLREQGLSEEEARLAARRLFGNPTLARERFFRSQRGFVFGMIFEDIRFGLRMLRKNLSTSVLAALTLALALGANTAIFSVLNGAILRSLPVGHPKELVILTDPNASMVLGGLLAGERSLLTFREFAELRDRMKTVSGLCAAQVTLERWPVRIEASPQELLRGRLVSENYFSVFGVKPAIGRFFPLPYTKTVGSDPYAVISYNLWQRQFGGRPEAIGRTLHLGHSSVEVIGVAPRGFRGETVGQDPDLWLPLLMQPLINPGVDGLSDTLAGTTDKLMWLHVFGRRRRGVTLAQVQAEVSVLFRAILEASYPTTLQPAFRREALQQNVIVKPLGGGVFHGRKEFEEEWLLLLALAGFVLLVACLNVANLLLARAAARTQEIAIRLSLGAARSRLILQFMIESLLLALFSGAGALIVAEVFLRAILRMLAEGAEPFTVSAALDAQVFAFAGTVTLLAGVLFGLAPAFRATGNRMNDDLKRSGRSVTGSRDRMLFARSLVVAQVALSLLLITGAALFLRTLWNLQSFALGYPKDSLLLLQVDASNAGYQGARLHRMYQQLSARMRDLPGVQAVSYSDRGLFSGFEGAFPLGDIDGFTSRREADRGSAGDSVAPGYFSTLQVPMLLGREFEPRDLASPPRLCIINESFAKHFFHGVNPLGRHFTTTLSDDDGREARRRLEVAGVARDIRDQSLRGPIEPKFYVPGGVGWFEIRTTADLSHVLGGLRKTISALNPDLSILSSRTLADTLQLQNAGPRRIAQLATFYGALALILAAFGVYGLLSYGVVRRTNEIGIRAALGADRSRIGAMIVKETAVLMVTGVLCGATITTAAARLFATQLDGASQDVPRWSLVRYEQTHSAVQLFGLTATDPLTVTIAAVLLVLLGLLAGWVPAVRAARVNPVEALRNG